jgi:hypothetical protein
MKKICLSIFIVGVICQFTSILISGCAQIGMPSGGPKDTSAPMLVKASPQINQINFNSNKIVLTFDEFIDLQDVQSNLLVSPVPNQNPVISGGLKSITIKLKDTLLPNTTYSIDFGNSIKDINEGNVYRNLCYLFSTGSSIDSLTCTGKVVLAESGKVDSTLLVLLYRNAVDSSVKIRKPNYIARVNGNGTFNFKNLPADEFNIYALKDDDGNKMYSSKKEIFAFNNDRIIVSNKTDSVLLFAYAETKETPNQTSSNDKKTKPTKLEFSTNLVNQKQDLLEPLILSFTSKLKSINTDSIILTDTNYHTISSTSINLDSTSKKIIISNAWAKETMLCLILFKNAFKDSMGLTLSKTDTIRFTTNSTADYGSLKLSFKNIDLSKHPLLQFMEGDVVRWKFKMESTEWFNKLILPGEYELRLLYDENNNGQWDPGDYLRKLQPEKAITLPQRISVKADWDNERSFIL